MARRMDFTKIWLLCSVLSITLILVSLSKIDEEKNYEDIIPDVLTDNIKKLKEKALSLVDDINKKAKNWKANCHKGFCEMDLKQKQGILGLQVDPPAGKSFPVRKPEDESLPQGDLTKNILNLKKRQTVTCSITEEFDARKQWPQCAEIIGNVRAQSNCASCWAVASASAFTDRMCIAKLKKGILTSSNDSASYASEAEILSCTDANFGCNGGNPSAAWNYMTNNGVVSGSNYTLKSGCIPYPFVPGSSTPFSTPTCSRACQAEWTKDYASDKKYASNPTRLTGSGLETQIINEIKTSGSIQAIFYVYDDFYYYSSGIYQHTSGDYVNGHAVRLIGYGTQSCSDGSSQKYWIGANSWNKKWGEGGFFRIVRGTNECNIESWSIDFGTAVA